MLWQGARRRQDAVAAGDPAILRFGAGRDQANDFAAGETELTADRDKSPALRFRIGRLLGAGAAVMMAAGVAVAALAAHAGAGRELATAALVLLTHAPMLAALGLAITLAAWPLATGALGGGIAFFGVLLFSADMAHRAFQDGALFAMAAPTGGSAMILGWTLVFLGLLPGLFRR
jgi:uncharacterized membrane protein YgdD (TMEM256/DUF423 family)